MKIKGLKTASMDELLDRCVYWWEQASEYGKGDSGKDAVYCRDQAYQYHAEITRRKAAAAPAPAEEG